MEEDKRLKEEKKDSDLINQTYELKNKDIQKNEEQKKVKFIENPLPGPKPHIKKEMNYDYEVPPDKMFFDNDQPSNNFYDI